MRCNTSPLARVAIEPRSLRVSTVVLLAVTTSCGARSEIVGSPEPMIVSRPMPADVPSLDASAQSDTGTVDVALADVDSDACRAVAFSACRAVTGAVPFAGTRSELRELEGDERGVLAIVGVDPNLGSPTQLVAVDANGSERWRSQVVDLAVRAAWNPSRHVGVVAIRGFGVTLRWFDEDGAILGEMHAERVGSDGLAPIDQGFVLVSGGWAPIAPTPQNALTFTPFEHVLGGFDEFARSDRGMATAVVTSVGDSSLGALYPVTNGSVGAELLLGASLPWSSHAVGLVERDDSLWIVSLNRDGQVFVNVVRRSTIGPALPISRFARTNTASAIRLGNEVVIFGRDPDVGPGVIGAALSDEHQPHAGDPLVITDAGRTGSRGAHDARVRGRMERTRLPARLRALL